MHAKKGARSALSVDYAQYKSMANVEASNATAV